MKKILVIHYSQSGQLTEILHNFTRSFQTDDVDFDLETRLVFKFGETETSVKDKLYERDIVLEFEKKVVYEN
jgi:hypothetical protein